MNNLTNKQKEIIKRVSNNIYDEAYGCWINMVYCRDYDGFDWLDQKELFLTVLKYLLDNNLAVLYPSNEIVLKNDFTSTKEDSEGVALWDVSSDKAIEYIREHMPLDPDYFDDDTSPYWFGDYCPRIGWVDKDTGKIEMGW